MQINIFVQLISTGLFFCVVFKKMKLRLGEITIDSSMIGLCESVNRRHPDCVKCRQIINQFILVNGVVVYIGDEIIKMKNIILDNYVSFCVNFMEVFYECGFVPVSIGETADGVPVPRVVRDPKGTITIQYDPKRELNILRYYRPNRSQKESQSATGVFGGVGSLEEDTSVHIFSDYGFDPDNKTGELRSPVMAVMSIISLAENFNACADTAEKFNCLPSLVTQSDKPENQTAPFGFNGPLTLMYSDRSRFDETGARVTDPSVVDKITANRDMIAIMKKHGDELKRNQVDRMRGPEDSNVKLPSNWPTLAFPLPQGASIANVPRAITRHDLLGVNDLVDNKICLMYGVPPSMLTASAKTVIASNSSDRVFMNTILQWRHRLSDILTSLHKLIYTEDLSLEYAKIIKKKQKMNIHSVEETDDTNNDEEKKKIKKEKEAEEITKFVGQTEFKVDFPITVTESTQELFYKHLVGVIDYPTFSMLCKNVSGIPVTEESEQAKEPWSSKAKLMLLAGMLDAQTKNVVKVKAENKKEASGGGDKKKKESEKKDSEKKNSEENKEKEKNKAEEKKQKTSEEEKEGEPKKKKIKKDK